MLRKTTGHNREDELLSAPSDATATVERRKPAQTQSSRRAQSERRILRAAVEQIAKRGVPGMTLADVGEAAGYSRGLPAHLFGSKDGLLRECIRRMMGEYWCRLLPEAGQRAGFAELRSACRLWIADLEDRNVHTRAYYSLLQEANREDAEEQWPELTAAVKAHCLGGQHRFADYIRAAIAKGEAAEGLDPDMEALLIHASIRGIGYQWLIRPDSVDLKRFCQTLMGHIDRLKKV
jgi:AcrR family transcriptional regulator